MKRVWKAKAHKISTKKKKKKNAGIKKRRWVTNIIEYICIRTFEIRARSVVLVASFECVYRTTKQLFAIVTIFYGYIDGFQINTQRKMTKVILFKPELNWSLVRLSVPPHGSLAVLVSNTISAFALAVRCPLPSCVPQSIDSLIVTFWLQLQLCKPFAMITFGNEMWAPVSCVVLWITSSSILHDGRTHTHTHTHSDAIYCRFKYLFIHSKISFKKQKSNK